MKKIYEHIDFAKVGHYQSILESNDIQTLVKNLNASMGTGEIPFNETFPELWVVNDGEFDEAIRLLQSYQPPDTEGLEDWVCSECEEDVEAQFGECWNCSTPRPGYEEE